MTRARAPGGLRPGDQVARVADPQKLKAEIRMPETQARGVQLGQPAVIDTRNGTVPGRVVCIDPAVQNGTVTVDVALEGPVPKGARPDLTVEGVIELELLANVLYVGRPVQGQSESTVGLFKRRGWPRVDTGTCEAGSQFGEHD